MTKKPASIDELMQRLNKTDTTGGLRKLARPEGSQTRWPIRSRAPAATRPDARRPPPKPAASVGSDLVLPLKPDPPGTPPQRGHVSEDEQRWLQSVLLTADRIREEIAPEIALDLPLQKTDELLERAQRLAKQAIGEHPQFASRARAWFDDVLFEVFGLGVLERFIRSDSVSEIMVNGPYVLLIERQGKIVETGRKFLDDDHVERAVKRIVLPLGREASEDHPLIDARLPDGSRVNAVLRPCAIDGPSITIRKFAKQKLTMQDLVGFSAMSPEMARFLEAIVVARKNVVVSGGTGSGKTTLINCLSGFIPDGERVVTIEDAAELQLKQRNVVRLETKKPTPKSPTEVSIRDCVINALRMRPERIVVGECRGGEALDMLQAMNTGHDGSMTTVHANDPRAAISRLETLSLMAGFDLPVLIVRKQIVTAIDFIVQASRLRDGSRKVTHITEVVRLEGEMPILSEIFKFDDQGDDAGGKVMGGHIATGNRPSCEPSLKRLGYTLNYR